jgi:hypothetical protein
LEHHPRAGRVALLGAAWLGTVSTGVGCALLSLDKLTGGILPPDAGAFADDSGDDSGSAARPTRDAGGLGADAGDPVEASLAVDSSSSSAIDSPVAMDSSSGPPPPSCANGQILCKGACVDPASNPRNCNGCGNVCASGVCGSSIVADMSSSPAGWSFNGTATYDSWHKSAVMTAAGALFQAGSVAYANPVAFDAFVAAFEFRIGFGGGTRSDGMGFLFQTSGSTAVGGNGGAMGMAGLAGYGVELDIYDNGACGDSTSDHIGVDSLAGCAADTTMPESLFATDVSSILDLADGNWHTATVSLAGGGLSVVVDGAGVAKGVALPGYVPNAPAYLGFAGATGGLVDSSGTGGYRSEVRNVNVTFPSPRCL